jgi:hypothetical protein
VTLRLGAAEAGLAKAIRHGGRQSNLGTHQRDPTCHADESDSDSQLEAAPTFGSGVEIPAGTGQTVKDVKLKLLGKWGLFAISKLRFYCFIIVPLQVIFLK